MTDKTKQAVTDWLKKMLADLEGPVIPDKCAVCGKEMEPDEGYYISKTERVCSEKCFIRYVNDDMAPGTQTAFIAVRSAQFYFDYYFKSLTLREKIAIIQAAFWANVPRPATELFIEGFINNDPSDFSDWVKHRAK